MPKFSNARLLPGTRHFCLLLIVALMAPPSPAQRYHISYAPNSQEGLFLQLIEQLEGDAKIAQMEAFLEKYPKHASSAWVLSFLQEHYSQAGDLDKALFAGERLLVLHPEDLEAATLNQKLAVRKGDPALVQKWGEAAKRAARELASASRQTQATAENFRDRQEYASGVVANVEYDAFKSAVDSDRPDVAVRSIENFLKTYPQSKYAAPALLPLMNAYRLTGANQKALDTAEKVLASNPNQEQALIIVAQVLLDRRANFPRIIAICNKLIAAYQKSPAGGDSADFEKRRALVAGTAYQILGYAHVFQNRFDEADRNLRLGLPYAKGSPQAEAGLLFYIGYANYYLEKYNVAAEYFRLCLEIPGPLQEQAKRQINSMREERRIQDNN